MLLELTAFDPKRYSLSLFLKGEGKGEGFKNDGTMKPPHPFLLPLKRGRRNHPTTCISRLWAGLALRAKYRWWDHAIVQKRSSCVMLR
ncbi:MAG: hypothetical protein A3G87_04365 [Omnitrophica bacterium RIFCSPLOWO2_12_FULL_50_11]|nr:MAG: hypothetical protein A3G87_04365 [Omnitrophica bacterium RIFCSPLOWO2_12_FULL_50_11]